MSGVRQIEMDEFQILSMVDETIPYFHYQLVIVYISSGCSLVDVVTEVSKLLLENMTTVITGKTILKSNVAFFVHAPWL